MTELGPGDVHVWHRLIDTISDADRDAALANLSADERERASRFMFDRDRTAFVAAHDLLRHALSQYEDLAPAAWTFAATPHGKPVLGPAHDDCGLRFNLSHTRGLVACVVARETDVGVDVEALDARGDVNELELARRFFSARESAGLEECREAERRARFIELWTLKESYVKAVGEGLSHPLDTFSFALPGAGAIRFQAPEGTDAADWLFALSHPTERHRLAVAARRRGGAAMKITGHGQLPWSSAASILARFSP